VSPVPEQTQETTPPEVDETPTDPSGAAADAAELSESAAGFIGLLFFGAIFYFAVFWDDLPMGWARWVITAAVFATVTAVWMAVRQWKWLGGKLARVARVLGIWGGVATDFLVFLVVVLLIICAAVYLDTEDQVVLLKFFAVVYFSILPAVLYLQFSSRKTLTVWKEYVLNLYKLKIDDPANLPRPPKLTRFHKEWQQARSMRFGGDADVPIPEPDATKLELASIYRQKFRDLFGPVPSVDRQKTFLSLRSTQKLQVVVATVLITIGWVFVVRPQSVFDRSFVPNDFNLVNLPPIPRESFAFAFLGAYFYILQMLVRRYFQNDLKATAYINATMRIVIVILLVWVLDPILAESLSQPYRSAIAFVIGVFPSVGWQLLQQAVVRVTRAAVRSTEPHYRLGDIDGLNIWYESRLLEVGVEDIQNLATTDIVDLMLNTRVPVDRLVDWIDQALLYIRIVEPADRKLLRSYGIRTATDLEDVFSDATLTDQLDTLLPNANGAKTPSRIRILRASLRTERNLQHVRAWKSYVATEESAEEPARAPALAAAPATG
jgi:hypothetical protein